MRTRYNIFAAVILLCFVFGCATPEKTAYNSLASIGLAVDKSMQAAAKAHVKGVIQDDAWAKIADLHSKFRVSYNLACDVSSVALSTPAPSDLVALATSLINTVNELLK